MKVGIIQQGGDEIMVSTCFFFEEYLTVRTDNFQRFLDGAKIPLFLLKQFNENDFRIV